MAENPAPTSLSSRPVFFWIVITLVLAIVVAAFWITIVNVVIPLITAVRESYF